MQSAIPRRPKSLEQLSPTNRYAAQKAGLDEPTTDLFSVGDQQAIPAATKESPKKKELGEVREPTALKAAPSDLGPFLSDKDVAHRYGVKKQTIWRWAKSSRTFPKPTKFQGTTTRWCLAELIEYDRQEMEARE